MNEHQTTPTSRRPRRRTPQNCRTTHERRHAHRTHQAHRCAGPYERVDARNGQANGFKPRNFHSSMCGLNLATPQVCGSDTLFRTSLLEKRSRSDRALKAAIASMYLQGVNTRRVTTVMGELCGFEVSSTPVSKLTAELDGEF